MISPRLTAGRSGFSLVELILGLGLAAVMGASVLMIYANAVRMDDISRKLSEKAFRSILILTVMESDLTAIMDYRFRVSQDAGERSAFIGEQDHLAFVLESPNGLRWVDYYFRIDQSKDVVRKTLMGERFYKNTDQIIARVNKDTENMTFMRLEADFSGMPIDKHSSEGAKMLAEGLDAKSVRFSYARRSGNSGLIWSDAWEGLDLPAAIRVDVGRLASEEAGTQSGYSKIFLLASGQ